MKYQRILTMQDISCIGQCSMTVALPILSACGHEVCILPSAVLSTHTGGFGKPAVQSISPLLPEIQRHWKENEITFDLIYIGYLGSVDAAELAEQIMDTMLAPGGITIVDPAMADHGKLYSGLSDAYAEKMMALCRKADVMIPNITEAVMMTGMGHVDENDEAGIRELLAKMPGNTVVLTGVGSEAGQTGFALRDGDRISTYFHDRVEKNYHGTGDIFASAFTGALAGGRSMEDSAQIAADFTLRCIELTFENPAHWYGVKFEKALPDLIRLLQK